MTRNILLPFILCALPFIAETAGDAPLDRATLRGVTAMGVVIDQLDPVLEREGLTREALSSRLERGLETAGVQLDPSAKEFLALRIMQVRANKGPYGVCINVAFYQPVILSRDQKARTATQTWEVETVLLADPKQLNEATIASVDELADRFVAAWQSVNKK
jgi:hypothetical protein